MALKSESAPQAFCLYGVKVISQFPLLDHTTSNSAVAPGEHYPVELKSYHQRPPVTGKNLNLSAEELTSRRTPLYQAHDRELFLHTDRGIGPSVPTQPWGFEVKDIVSFTWDGGNPVVYYQFHEHGNHALLVFWFIHIFLPLYLTLEQGYDFIHASAVEVDEKPILFIAESTGGKSTLGDYFLKQGHAMLSDDKVATFLCGGQFYAVPSHPHHRPWREYEVLGETVENFAASAKPIHAFYLLERGEPDSEIEITEVTGFRKFQELMPNYLYSFSFLQQQRLRWLGQLADQSLVFRVRRPWNMDRMQEIYEAICTHSRELG